MHVLYTPVLRDSFPGSCNLLISITVNFTLSLATVPRLTDSLTPSVVKITPFSDKHTTQRFRNWEVMNRLVYKMFDKK